MDLKKIPCGNNFPNDMNVIIEIPAEHGSVKYEFDKEIGAIVVDRFMPTAMFYPANYGFVPSTLGQDGDPIDVLVYTRSPLHPGVIINCRPLGVLVMEDESGGDEKILAVPNSKTEPYMADYDNYQDLPPLLLKQIEHFFENYKGLEPEKWVKISGWQGLKEHVTLCVRQKLRLSKIISDKYSKFS